MKVEGRKVFTKRGKQGSDEGRKIEAEAVYFIHQRKRIEREALAAWGFQPLVTAEDFSTRHGKNNEGLALEFWVQGLVGWCVWKEIFKKGRMIIWWNFMVLLKRFIQNF